MGPAKTPSLARAPDRQRSTEEPLREHMFDSGDLIGRERTISTTRSVFAFIIDIFLIENIISCKEKREN